MKTRITTAAVGLVVLALVLFTFNTPVFHVIVSVITLLATHEIYNALGFTKKELPLYLVQVPYVFLVMYSSYGAVRDFILPASFALILFYCVYLVAARGEIDFQRTSGFVAFSAIVVFCFYSLVYLKALFPAQTYQGDAIFFIMLSLSFAWGGDSSAYFAGRFFGKHKLCPEVSPHKTVEGAIGGVLGSMAFGVAATLIYANCAGRTDVFAHTSLGVSMYILVALLGGFSAVLGIYGDLFASVVKRQCAIKDYGTVFPGHGGIVDRFDSVMFIAPFVTLVLSAVFG